VDAKALAAITSVNAGIAQPSATTMPWPLPGTGTHSMCSLRKSMCLRDSFCGVRHDAKVENEVGADG
jgi:hypothetical protein